MVGNREAFHLNPEARMVAFEVEKGVMYMAVSTKPKTGAKERAEKLEAEGKCVCCEQPLKEGEQRRKGRCPRCHYKYRMGRLETPKDKRALYDARLMREGTLMESRQGQHVGK
jgi:uncharacterized paraquat-inducible protein A